MIWTYKSNCFLHLLPMTIPEPAPALRFVWLLWQIHTANHNPHAIAHPCCPLAFWMFPARKTGHLLLPNLPMPSGFRNLWKSMICSLIRLSLSPQDRLTKIYISSQQSCCSNSLTRSRPSAPVAPITNAFIYTS